MKSMFPWLNNILKHVQKCCLWLSSDSCDSIIVSLNFHLKEKSISTIANAVDLIIFADEATSAARKEMMGLFLRAHDEEEKEVTIEFVSIASVASTKSEILMNKVREILLNNNIVERLLPFWK